jgi:hypothetical protein
MLSLQATTRIRKNAAYFRVNYAAAAAGATALALVLHPGALAVLAAAAGTASAAGNRPFSSPVEGTAGKEADYGHFAEMLASVMMVREGGVDKALEAVPMLHDTTHAYIKTMSLAETHPEWFAGKKNASEWAGLKASDVDLLKAIKDANKTESDKEWDPLFKLGEKIEEKLGGKEKNKTLDWEGKKMEALEEMMPHDKMDDDKEFLGHLNDKLSK